MKISKLQYLLSGLVLLLAMFFHHESIFDYPRYIHAWAQADRYAIALNFLWNDFNILEAETYLYNIEFPTGFAEPRDNSITMVNLPIHEYLIALLMKVSGITAPIIFRFYILCCSFLGLFFTHKIGQLFKLRGLSQIALIVFACTSPVYVYYQDNFLPSIPGLALAIGGLYFYIRYLKQSRIRFFAFAAILFTITSIYRTTFIIPFIAILGVEFIQFIRKEAKLKPFLIILVTSGLALYLHRLHNEYQIHTYGSVFLYYLVPALSWEKALEFVSVTVEQWKYDYLNIPQWIFFGLLGIVGLLNTKLIKIRNSFHLNIGLFLAASLMGYAMFTAAMLSKFPQHDYYFIDTFYIPLLILVISLLKILDLQHQLFPNWVKASVVLIFSGSSVAMTFENKELRRQDNEWDYSSELIDIYASGAEILDSINIAKDAKLLVFGPKYPNLPMTLLNRKGFTVFWTNDWKIDQALRWDFDYIVLPNRYFLKEYYSIYPDLINRFNKIFDNGKFSVCTLKTEASKTTLSKFFQLNQQDLVFEINEGFENDLAMLNGINLNQDTFKGGSFSTVVRANQEYALQFVSDSLSCLEDYAIKLKISSNFLVFDTLKRVEFIVGVLDKKGNNQFYETFELSSIYQGANHWHNFELIYQLPRLIPGEYIFKMYYWNRDKSTLYLDDINYQFYK